MTVMAQVDFVTVEIIRGSLVTLTEEMGLAMGRTSHSPIFNEGRDYSCAVFDAGSEMIAQAAFDPLHLGAMPFAVEWALADLPVSELEPGDVILTNDPYRGGSHLPDFTMLLPVFHAGEVVAICANRAHQVDVGGAVPGSFYGEATEIFQEGVRVPPLLLYRRGEPVEAAWKLLLANVRDSDSCRGDLQAMYGSLQTGGRRIAELAARHGVDTFRAVLEEIKNYSERRMRAELEGIPDGTYQFVNWLEDDGQRTEPLAVAVTVTIEGSDVIVDFSGSSPQALGPVNAPYAVTASNVYCPFIELVSPDIPTNHGCYRPITVIAPPGTVVNPEHPAPVVGGNVETSARINEAVMGALASAVPERVIAASHGTYLNLTAGGIDPRTGGETVFYLYAAGGWGGSVHGDGNAAVMGTWSNDRQSSLEANEQAYPIRFDAFELTTGLAGDGRHRGGLGTTMKVRVLTERLRVSLLAERCLSSPFGLFGGLPPEPWREGLWNQVLFELADGRTGTAHELFGRSSASKWGGVDLGPDDVFVYLTVGGAGYGPPAERDPALRERDARLGYLEAR
ncbi:MAG: hydantoinase B/oxoprolinase family protein [Actinobacteria bacterium]|nr:hydantoinase B/oxoprolinase family protein [Actinomycetota bacterium]